MSGKSRRAPKDQMALFDDTEALPLFSGTAQRVEPTGPAKSATSAKQATFSNCPTCHDTGKIGKRYCWCKAGVTARKVQGQAQQELSDVEVFASQASRPARGSFLEL